MTPKQVLDSFSETLMQDARILSAQEQVLLTTLLRQARNAAGTSVETQDAVRAVIASAVGETVAQRAFAVLGQSIVERILAGSEVGEDGNAEIVDAKKTPKGKPRITPMADPMSPSNPGQPQPPRADPISPASPVQPQPPRADPISPASPVQPQPPRANPISPTSPVQPQSPRGFIDRVARAGAQTAVQERPLYLKARCVVLDEFLAPQDVEELTRFTLEHEREFQTSEVISPVAEGGGMVNYEHRRSRVLMDTGRFQELMLARIRPVLPEILEKLGMEEFAVSGAEAQITASNDGDFFRFHSDNGSETVASRYLTFVYFFHREPQQFEGGKLRIHNARLEGESYVSAGSYDEVSPRQNQIVFFPCELLHEITELKCASGQFADSRFTFNGWLRR